ncbi:tripartite tricarboxylate transporter substrate binding protein [Oceanospirillum sediminis]|uniref:Tripartite tricarboxylate transporter substrate binding protein n=1 Tax=Oceanospirillum sediminis TaxID=2760088 RepID=A0A839IT59_9GAMM|nr:tripartite tricarboxylate transporter substrate binding protein [Oceanospirillum sediminis]MBB1487617.1 tripartite tricarboxylate transporter substrate binding protein [Oceanospirillum sediminis]
MRKIKKVLIAAAMVAAPLLTSHAVAAEYPNRPVKFVVPWPPGDLEDVLTRLIAEEMSRETGKPASVLNKPGGGGVLGASSVARARADGLTIGSFVADLVTTQLVSGNAPYDQDTFEPVGIFLDYPFVIATKADAPYSNLQELAEYSKSNKVSLGHFGYQALPTAITFKAAEAAGIHFSSDAPFDSNDCSTLANGDADVINTTTQQILACIKSGEVKLLTSLTNERLSIAPQIPTLQEETGIAQTTWNGLFVKKGTPQAVKDKIASIAQKALKSKKVQQLVENTGAAVFWIPESSAKNMISNDYKEAESLLKFMQK